MKRNVLAPALSLALLATMIPVFAGPMVLDGQLTQTRVSGLNSEIKWNTSLGQALDTARREGKMVFWVHMLGSMNGTTWSAGNSLRAVSLSSDPAFSLLKKYFVCGYKDITYEPYAGVSGRHEVNGNAVDTSNGAGPHNLQLFFLASDGTVLSVLPGYWHSQDLVPEMNLAAQLDKVWTDNSLSRTQKDQMFKNMQLAHIGQHSQGMVKRSKMQSFDMQYEAQNRLANSDTILDRGAASYAVETHNKIPPYAFKTTDRLMHERMASRPFLSYNQFDVAAFAEYGKPKYDKHEDYRMADGTVNKDAAKSAPLLGSPQSLEAQKPMGRRRMMMQQQYPQPNGWGTKGTWGNNGT